MSYLKSSMFEMSFKHKVRVNGPIIFSVSCSHEFSTDQQNGQVYFLPKVISE